MQLRDELASHQYLVRISLSPEDIAGEQAPPYYLLISRNFYLWKFINDVENFFDPYAAKVISSRQLWFEYHKQPIYYDFPFGLVYDLYVMGEEDSKQPEQQEQAIEITCHLTNPPKHF